VVLHSDFISGLNFVLRDYHTFNQVVFFQNTLKCQAALFEYHDDRGDVCEGHVNQFLQFSKSTRLELRKPVCFCHLVEEQNKTPTGNISYILENHSGFSCFQNLSYCDNVDIFRYYYYY